MYKPNDKKNTPPKTEANMTHRAELDNPDSWAIRLLNSSVTFTARYLPIGLVAYSSKSRDLAGPGRTKPLWLSGDVIGYNNLSLWVDNRWNDTRITTPVFVIMNNPFWNKFCTLVMVVMVLLNSINMGAQLDIGIIVKVFKKPVGPVVGFVSQFLFMPLFSFLVGWIITDDYLFRCPE